MKKLQPEHGYSKGIRVIVEEEDDAKNVASGVFYKPTRRSEMMTVAPRKIATFNEETANDRFVENKERSTPICKSLEQRTILLVTNPPGSEQISCQGTGMFVVIARSLTQLR